MKYKVVRTYLNYGTYDLEKAFNAGWQYKTAHVLVKESSNSDGIIEYILYKKED